MSHTIYTNMSSGSGSLLAMSWETGRVAVRWGFGCTIHHSVYQWKEDEWGGRWRYVFGCGDRAERAVHDATIGKVEARASELEVFTHAIGGVRPKPRPKSDPAPLFVGPLLPSISDPDSLPPSVRHCETSRKIWRRLEFQARGTLLVHGSEALKDIRHCGNSTDPKRVIAAMVKAGTLRPLKCDLAGADHSDKNFVIGLTYGGDAKHVKQHAWCESFATFWTYEPGNRTLMKWCERPLP